MLMYSAVLLDHAGAMPGYSCAPLKLHYKSGLQFLAPIMWGSSCVVPAGRLPVFVDQATMAEIAVSAPASRSQTRGVKAVSDFHLMHFIWTVGFYRTINGHCQCHFCISNTDVRHPG